nr:dihydrofolate reductase family protein [uncultured Nocardioides sp.]
MDEFEVGAPREPDTRHGRLLLAFTMSLDGFVAGPDVRAGQAMGQGGERLHDWLFTDTSECGVDADMAQEVVGLVGAVILGRRTFDVGLAHWGDTPYPVPSFVLTHQRREPLVMRSAAFTFVDDGILSALHQAHRAASGRDIVVMGARTAQQYLRAGLVDDLILQVAPVLLGSGSRLFDDIAPGPTELRRERVLGSPFVTHLKFSVTRDSSTG